LPCLSLMTDAAESPRNCGSLRLGGSGAISLFYTEVSRGLV